MLSGKASDKLLDPEHVFLLPCLHATTTGYSGEARAGCMCHVLLREAGDSPADRVRATVDKKRKGPAQSLRALRLVVWILF